MTKPQQLRSSAPTKLKTAGKRMWSDITGKYQLRPDELRILEDACREADLIDRLEAELGKPGVELTVRGSQGQPVANPLVTEIRQHRQTLKALTTSLKLPDEDEARAPGDPSAAGRALVANRWRRGA